MPLFCCSWYRWIWASSAQGLLSTPTFFALYTLYLDHRRPWAWYLPWDNFFYICSWDEFSLNLLCTIKSCSINQKFVFHLNYYFPRNVCLSVASLVQSEKKSHKLTNSKLLQILQGWPSACTLPPGVLGALEGAPRSKPKSSSYEKVLLIQVVRYASVIVLKQQFHLGRSKFTFCNILH